jgi:hypothetical protein
LADSTHDQLRRTVIAWSLVATPGEQCVLWHLDERVGVTETMGHRRREAGRHSSRHRKNRS